MTRAVVIGSGPNGLAAAITLAGEGIDVEVREAETQLGGGIRSRELTLPGFVHDVCGSVQPLALASPFFRTLDLDVEWVQPLAPAAHPFDDGTAVLLERGIDATGAWLGRDAAVYHELVGPLVRASEELLPLALGSLPPSPRELARAAGDLGFVRFQRVLRAALGEARAFVDDVFTTERARAWFAGHCAHSILPLERRPSAGFGLMLSVLGHAVGWPIVRGGSQRLAESLVRELELRGGRVIAGAPVDELPAADLVVADVPPRELVRIARGRLPTRYEQRLLRYRHAPGAFKVDWALAEPIPWRAAEVRRAGTVHLGASLDEISHSEWSAWSGRTATRPFVILVQPTLFDTTRAPQGKHTAWAYCHVPNGSDVEMTDAIEAQVERFAPGFRDVVLDRHTFAPRELEAHNRNLVGGDINGGAMDLTQLLFRPAPRLVPHSTPLDGVYLCSASTPPGGGVHGMCGYLAVQAALRSLR